MAHHIIDGIINLNKSPGKTSFQMVAAIRRITGIRKIGHSGTLDPDATGVLPIFVGRATKLVSFLLDSSKTYRAEIEFGRVTDTYDSSGEVTQESDTSLLTIDGIEASIQNFCGPIEQIPPMYSAIKRHGKPLYQMARAGIEIERKPRKVNIFRLEIMNWENPILTIEVECSKGTYIRSLAHDLGQALNCGGHLKSLVRTQTGPFLIEQSVTLSEFEEAFKNDSWHNILYPVDSVLTHLGSIAVNEDDEGNIACGRTISNNELNISDGAYYRAYNTDGRFLALIRFSSETGLWHPTKVFI